MVENHYIYYSTVYIFSMHKEFNPQDHYFHKAKQDGYLARSAYKLEEIDKKFGIFWPKKKSVLDIGCAPGSRVQYIRRNTTASIIWFDLKTIDLILPDTYLYTQDITDTKGVQEHLDRHRISSFDVILSDMAPDTVGDSATDALRSTMLIRDTMWLYDRYLSPRWTFVIKIFMGPWFEELLTELRSRYGIKSIKTYKPKACRDSSKETYIIKV